MTAGYGPPNRELMEGFAQEADSIAESAVEHLPLIQPKEGLPTL